MSTRVRIASLSALRHRSYLALWIGAFVSNVGTWMETIGLGVHVTQLTGKAGWTGTVAALMYMPAMVFGPIGGALADRFDRRRYLAIGSVVQLLIASAMAVLAWHGHLTIPAVSVLSALAGVVSALLGPAFTALLVDLVPPEDLHSAFSLSSAQYNLGRVLGPMLAAAAIASGGLTTAFTLNAVSFLAVLVSMTVVKAPPLEHHAEVDSVWRGIRSGFTAVGRDPAMRLVLVAIGVIAVCVSPFIGLIPVMAIKVFARGPAATSLLVSCQGIGAVLAAVLVGTVAEIVGRRRLLEVSAIAIGPIAILYWLAPHYGLALVGIFVLGAAYLVVITSANTVFQSRAPRHLQARVSSLYSVMLGGGYAIGLVLQGWLGDRFGLRAVPAAFAFCFFALALGLRVFKPTAYHSLEAGGTEPAPAGAPLPTLSTLPPPTHH